MNLIMTFSLEEQVGAWRNRLENIFLVFLKVALFIICDNNRLL